MVYNMTYTNMIQMENVVQNFCMHHTQKYIDLYDYKDIFVYFRNV